MYKVPLKYSFSKITDHCMIVQGVSILIYQDKKGFSKLTFVDHQMFKVRVSLYFKTNFVKGLLKVDHRWSPDVLILLIGWAAAWENLQWALNPFLTPGENSVCV